jgi:hypothetical protein
MLRLIGGRRLKYGNIINIMVQLSPFITIFYIIPIYTAGAYFKLKIIFWTGFIASKTKYFLGAYPSYKGFN